MCADISLGLRMELSKLRRKKNSVSILSETTLLLESGEEFIKAGRCLSMKVESSSTCSYGAHQRTRITFRAIVPEKLLKVGSIVRFENMVTKSRFTIDAITYTADIDHVGPVVMEVTCREVVGKAVVEKPEVNLITKELANFKTLNEMRKDNGFDPLSSGTFNVAPGWDIRLAPEARDVAPQDIDALTDEVLTEENEKDPDKRTTPHDPIFEMWEEQIKGPEEESPEEVSLVVEESQGSLLLSVYNSKAFWPVVGFVGAILLLLFEYLYLAE